MHRRQTAVHGHRRAQTPAVRIGRGFIPQVTALTGGGGRQLVARNLFFAGVSAVNVVGDSVAMTVHAGQARLHVNILVARPFLGMFLADIKGRVAEVAPV